MTTEHLQVTMQAADGAASQTISTGIFRLGVISVPRNSKVKLLRGHGSVGSANAPSLGNTNCRLQLMQDDVASTPATLTFSAGVLWSAVLAHTISGTPNNTHTEVVGQQIEVDFGDHPRGNALSSKGPRSNHLNGWSLYATSDNGSFELMCVMTVDYDLIWIGGPSSKRGLDDIQRDMEEFV